MKPHTIHEVYQRGSKLFTKSITNTQFKDELIFKEKDVYRHWDPWHSKLAAFITKGCKNIHLKKNDKILYLGCSTGTTVSHLADIIGTKGLIYAVEIAPTMMRTFYLLTQHHHTIAPILANANQPTTYKDRITTVDYLYQDVATRTQIDIFIANAKFLKPKGFGFLAIKARSIDVTRNPKQVYAEARQTLQKHFTIVEERTLEPFSKDHLGLILKH